MAGEETRRREDLELDVWLRRQALQIAMQLPDDRSEALRVLSLTREIVTGFLSPDLEDDKDNRVVQLVR